MRLILLPSGTAATPPLTGGFLRAPITHKALYAVAYLALFGSLLAFSAYIYLAKAWPPAKMGTYAHLNPLVAVLLSSRYLNLQTEGTGRSS